MASISKRQNGSYEIEISNGNRRQRIYIGKQTKRAAARIINAVNEIVSCNVAGTSMSAETAKWTASIDDALHNKLVVAGVLQQRQRRTLGAFITSYKAGKQWKPSTVTAFNDSEKHIVGFFGGDVAIDKITAEQAAAFRVNLVQKGLAEATVAKTVKHAKGLFTEAKRQRLITDCPFEFVKSGSQVNKERQYFISADEMNVLMDACKDSRQRLMLALWRWGGLRATSDLIGLRWDEVDWERNRFTVHATKTEGKRTVPLFPELQKYFREHWESIPEGTVDGGLVFPKLKVHERTFIDKVADRCGLGHIEKIRQNMRSSRATELLATYPAHIVNQWLGHTEAVAMSHYRQTNGKATESYYEQAATVTGKLTGEHADMALQSIETKNDGTADGACFASVCKTPLSGTEGENLPDTSLRDEERSTPI